MRRNVVVAIMVSAVIGCAVGVYAAVVVPARLSGPRFVAGSTSDGPITSAAPRAAGTNDRPDPTPPSPGGSPVIYLAGGRLHDGTRSIPVDLPKSVTSWPVTSVQ